MVEPHNIICKHCGKDTGYTKEQFAFCVLTDDVRCPHCHGIAIYVNKVTWSDSGPPLRQEFTSV